MAGEWYVFRGDKKHGPFTTEALKRLAAEKRLKPTDLLQRDGMEQPVAASRVKGLFTPEEPAGEAEQVDRPTTAAKPERAPKRSLAPTRRAATGTRSGGDRDATRRGWLVLTWLYIRSACGDLKRWWRGIDLDGTAEKATLALAERCFELEVGDPDLRDRITEVDHSIASAKKAEQSTATLEKDKKQLLLQFGTAILDGEPPSGAEEEYRKAADAKAVLTEHNHEYDAFLADPDVSPKWQTLPALSKIVLLGGAALILLSCAGFGASYNRKRKAQEAAKVQKELADPKSKTNAGRKIDAFHTLLAHIRELPNPLDGRAAHDRWTTKAEKLLDEFREIPFDPAANRSEAKRIVEDYARQVDGKYRGKFFNLLANEVESIGITLITE